MVGMSRDKGGAAAVIGFVATAAKLGSAVNIKASVALVRNSVGSNGYVADEIIRSRAGVRVRVGNTDAEGRMVMTDLLARMKEIALSSERPSSARLFTVATLTGHALRAYGNYAIAMDNGPAFRNGIAKRLRASGAQLADPFEISRLRREDFEFVKGSSPREDLVSSNNLPSTLTSRGHQYPMAFMIKASGLDSHSLSSKQPLAYTHLDIAASAELPSKGTIALGRVTGSPLLALSGAFLSRIAK